MSFVTCHLSHIINLNSHTTYPPHLIPQIPECTVGCFTKTEHINQKNTFKNKEIIKTFQQKGVLSFFNFSATLFDQKSPVHARLVVNGGDITHQAERTLCPKNFMNRNYTLLKIRLPLLGQ